MAIIYQFYQSMSGNKMTISDQEVEISSDYHDYFGIELNLKKRDQQQREIYEDIHQREISSTSISNQDSNKSSPTSKDRIKCESRCKEKTKAIKKAQKRKGRDRSGQGKNICQHIYSKILTMMNSSMKQSLIAFLQFYHVKKQKCTQATNQLILIYLYLFFVKNRKIHGQAEEINQEGKRQVNNNFDIMNLFKYFTNYLNQRLASAYAKEINNQVEKLKIQIQIKIIQELIQIQSGQKQLQLQRLQVISSPLFTNKQSKKSNKHFSEMQLIYQDLRCKSNFEQIFSVLNSNTVDILMNVHHIY